MMVTWSFMHCNTAALTSSTPFLFTHKDISLANSLRLVSLSLRILISTTACNIMPTTSISDVQLINAQNANPEIENNLLVSLH